LMQDTIAEEPSNHGAMFVPIVAGSDKTTVSVATGHQEYHPVYMSPGNLTNIARRTHGNAVLPVAFLPIPKSMFCSNGHQLGLTSLCSYKDSSNQADGHWNRTYVLSTNVSCISRSPLRTFESRNDHTGSRQMS